MVRLLVGLLLLAAPAWGESLTIPGPEGVMLRAELHRPAGAAVAPAIVALHGCGGAFPARDRQWSEALLKGGHIVLLPDSFASRGLGSQCRVTARVATSDGLRRQDARAAAIWLTAQPGTPAGGVVLIGWSNGGSTVLALAPDPPPGVVRGLVAFYPGCRGALQVAGWRTVVPLLILMGEADDWTPAAPCHDLASRAGPMVTLVTYPGAYHQFDTPTPVRVVENIPSSPNADGSVHAGGNPAAAADALVRLHAFLAGLPALR